MTSLVFSDREIHFPDLSVKDVIQKVDRVFIYADIQAIDREGPTILAPTTKEWAKEYLIDFLDETVNDFHCSSDSEKHVNNPISQFSSLYFEKSEDQKYLDLIITTDAYCEE